MSISHGRTLGVLHEMLEFRKEVLGLVNERRHMLFVVRLLEDSRKVGHTLWKRSLLLLLFPFLCPLTIRALVTHLQLFTPLAGTCGRLLRLISFGRVFVFLDVVVLESYRTAGVRWQTTLHPHFHGFQVVTVWDQLEVLWVYRDRLRILLCCTQSRWSIRNLFPRDFTSRQRDHRISHFLSSWWDTIRTFPTRSKLARILGVFRWLRGWSLEQVWNARQRGVERLVI